MTSLKTLPPLLMVLGLLTACGASGTSGAVSGVDPSVGASTRVLPASGEKGSITVQDGAGYVFQPARPPSDGRKTVLTAQQAYNAMAGRGQRSAAHIPRATAALYGYLTEPDTMPPATRMPVWAFREDGGCLNTFRGTNARCFRWTFARAADGKDLGVVNQQTHS